MSDIFISYKREDFSLAKSLAEQLTELGWLVWWDHNIPAGKDYDKVIEEEINAAKCVLVLWTSHSINSRNVKDEANAALERSILIPILVGPIKPPMGFRMIQSIIFNDNDVVEKNELDDLVNQISRLIGTPPEIKKKSKSNKEAVVETIIPEQSHLSTESETPAKPQREVAPSFNSLLEIFTKYKELNGFFVEPLIPQNKVNNAKTSCDIRYYEPVLAMFDLTSSGNGDDCIAFTPYKVYYSYGEDDRTMTYDEFEKMNFRIVSESLTDNRISINGVDFNFGFIKDPLTQVIELFNEIKSNSKSISKTTEKNLMQLKLAARIQDSSASHLQFKNLFQQFLTNYRHIPDFYVKPNIPSRKLKGASGVLTNIKLVDGIKITVPPNDIIAVFDLTVFGGCDDFIVFSPENIFYAYYGKVIRFDYKIFSESELQMTSPYEINIGGGKVSPAGCKAGAYGIAYVLTELQTFIRENKLI